MWEGSSGAVDGGSLGWSSAGGVVGSSAVFRAGLLDARFLGMPMPEARGMTRESAMRTRGTIAGEWAGGWSGTILWKGRKGSVFRAFSSRGSP